MHQPAPTRTNATKGEGSLYQKTNGIWMYSIMHGGKRLTKSLRTRDEKEANRLYLQHKRNFAGKIERGELDPATVTNATVERIFADYLRQAELDGLKSLYVIQKVVGKIQQGRDFSPGRKVSTLTTKDFSEYIQCEQEAGTKAATIKYRLALFKAALRHGSKLTPATVGTVPYIPSIKVENTRQGFLEYEDHYSVLDALPESLKALFVIAFHSGCRLGEVVNMRWSDVDWTNKVIRLPQTKNGTQRNLPFWGGIEEHLRSQKTYRDQHHPECEHLFFWRAEDTALAHGGVRNVPGSQVQDFRKSWTNAIEEAHRLNPNVLAGLLFHDLRRSGVRVMVQKAGVPESQAMLLSGHRTRAMLERYNIVSLKDVQNAGNKLDAWSKAQQKATGSKSGAGSKSGGSKSRPGSKRRATA